MLPPASVADGVVWAVRGTGGAPPVYLAGTIHKLPPEQYPLPEEYQTAYRRADIAVFETDIAAMRSPAVQARVAQQSRLPERQTLITLLDPAVHDELSEYCEQTGFPIEYLEPLRPAAAMLALLSAALQSQGFTAPGVDEHFFDRARQDDKETRALETIDEQIDYMLSLDQGAPDRFVRQAIDDLRAARDGAMAEGMRLWRQGERSAIAAHFLSEQMLLSPELYRALLVERNRNWLPAIRGYLETSSTELVLVGVAHLVGEHGLINVLESEGYEVRRLHRP